MVNLAGGGLKAVAPRQPACARFHSTVLSPKPWAEQAAAAILLRWLLIRCQRSTKASASDQRIDTVALGGVPDYNAEVEVEKVGVAYTG